MTNSNTCTDASALLIEYDEIDYAASVLHTTDEVVEQLIALKTWLYQRLCNGDPALGRKGPVCPYSKYSMRKKLFWLSPYMKAQTNADEVMMYMMNILDQFTANPIAGNDEIFRTYVVAFPFVGLDQTSQLIDETHVMLKPFFIARGLMIGQFHNNCHIGGVHNPEFMPLHSPMPLFVVRNIVQNDYLLLKDDVHYLKAYDLFMKETYPDDYAHYHNKIQILPALSYKSWMVFRLMLRSFLK